MTKKTQMKLRKILTLVSCAVLLVCVTVVGTIAYLTANTKPVKNTFTVGNVTLDSDVGEGLDEADVNEYGEVINTNRVLENEYKLIPGHEYTKDPTVHVKAGSEQCYVFVKVVNGISAIEAASEADEGGYKNIKDQMAANGWKELEENVFFYAKKADGTLAEDGTVVDARTAQQDLLIFAKFKLDNNAAFTVDTDGDGNVDIDYADAEINIDAYAVQADGFDSASEAWTSAKGTWDF